MAEYSISQLREILDSGLASDALDYYGLRNQTLTDPFLAPVDPDDTVIGYAFPVQAEVVHDTPESVLVREFKSIDELTPDSVYILTGGDEEILCPMLGEMLALAAQVRGSTGAVINAPIRDTKGIRSLGYPVIARGRLPTSSKLRAEVTGWNVPIKIRGVNIAPGDLVVGDIDGVTIVPGDLIEQVVKRCKEVKANEAIIRQKIENGTPTEIAYPQISAGTK